MEGWQEDLLHPMLTSDCEHELLERLCAFARNLGFDYCAYGLRKPVPVSRPRILLLNNYPTAWQNRYEENSYLSVDPTVKHGMHSSLPILWSDNIFSSARELWEEARSFGLRYGWAQSSHDASGTSSLLTFARSDEPISKQELQEKTPRMILLTQIAHIGMSGCLSKKLPPDAEHRLTEREITVIRWTADGKTSSDIARILNITERTVNFHVNNVVEKLGVANKLAATVKAAVLGML